MFLVSGFYRVLLSDFYLFMFRVVGEVGRCEKVMGYFDCIVGFVVVGKGGKGCVESLGIFV